MVLIILNVSAGGLSILYGLFSIKRTMNFIPVYFSMIGNGGISVYG
ncbi:MAG: hypothetical protein KJ739_00300 [Nitrospinae bacterium]|nr:hypothetical protein [Nitrospinota bacterium]